MTQERFSSLTKLSNIGSRLQKYPKVSKKYPKVSELAKHSVTSEHICRASSGLGLASEDVLSLSSQEQLEINFIILMQTWKLCMVVVLIHNSPTPQCKRTARAFFRRMLLQPLWKVQPLSCRLGNEHHVFDNDMQKTLTDREK